VNELVLGLPPAGKNVSTETEDIVGIRHHATTDEETSELARVVVNCRVCELAIAL
jgi:hypothetical protein